MQANPCFSLRNARIREQEAARLPQNISHTLLLPWIFPKNSRKTLEWSAHNTNCSEGQMPSWEKGQCTGKTKTGYAPELPTGVCYVRIVQLQNLSGLRVLSDAKVRDPQSSNISTHRYTTFKRLIITISNDSQEQTVNPGCALMPRRWGSSKSWQGCTQWSSGTRFSPNCGFSSQIFKV